jgi:hydrogenase expression/formation protein HypE
VVRDAKIATSAGRIHAMHDPTEGGLAGALWELSDASDHRLVFDPSAVLIPELSRKVCSVFHLDPLATIASGALLLAVAQEDVVRIQKALESEGIASSEIGQVEEGPAGVWQVNGQPLTRPARDDIASVYEEAAS